MAVPAYKRNESKIEFLNTFKKLRKCTNAILMRDFGIKPRSYTVELLKDIYEIKEDDFETLTKIMGKYGMKSSEVEKYPSWIVDSWRHEIRDILKHISVEIELANSIYISSWKDVDERRMHWNLAVGYLNALKDSFNEIVDTIKVSVGAFEEAQELIKKEINLIKGVRKSDNKKMTKEVSAD